MTLFLEPPRIAPAPRRSAPALELPPTARRFLRTRRGRQVGDVVRLLHAWLGRRRLGLAALTPTHLRRFLARPRELRLAPRTSYVYWHALRRYLQWLRDRGLLGFDPEHLRRHPKRLPALAREFLASLGPTHRPGTCRSYMTSLRRLYGWLDPRGLTPQRLARHDLTPWFQQLHAAGLHPSYRRHLLLDARTYLQWLADRHPLRTAPEELIRSRDLPKLPSYLPRPLAPQADRQLQRRLAASHDLRHQALLLMRHTGLRIGELRSLDYDCLRGDGRHALLKVPLGKLNTERLVPLDPTTVALVRRLQATPPRRRPWLVSLGETQTGYAALRHALADVSHDLPDPAPITSHRLRHTYATEMLSACMSLLGVMRLLGHRDFRMTLRYTAITPETVGKEYYQALTQLAAKYRLPTPPTLPPEPDPAQMLDHLGRWLRKHVAARRPLRPLLKRLQRLQHDLALLKPESHP